MTAARVDGRRDSSRELRGAEEGGGRKNGRKAEHEEVGAGIALGGLVSRGEMQTRQTEGLAATSTWNCNFRTESLFARDEIIKTGLN